MVWPSGSAFATISVATTPPAPGRLSMMICWPIWSLIFCATTRAVMSPTPPGPNGTRKRIGLDGNCCALAVRAMLASRISPIPPSPPLKKGGSFPTPPFPKGVAHSAGGFGSPLPKGVARSAGGFRTAPPFPKGVGRGTGGFKSLSLRDRVLEHAHVLHLDPHLVARLEEDAARAPDSRWRARGDH